MKKRHTGASLKREIFQEISDEREAAHAAVERREADEQRQANDRRYAAERKDALEAYELQQERIAINKENMAAAAMHDNLQQRINPQYAKLTKP